MNLISETDFELLKRSLGRRVRAGMRKYRIPGIAVGFMVGDQRWAAGFGLTNLENPLPVTTHTLFQIGSITKTFTALAAVRLSEAGLLDLDAPVRQYLPGLRLADEDTAARVTVRQEKRDCAKRASEVSRSHGPPWECIPQDVGR